MYRGRLLAGELRVFTSYLGMPRGVLCTPPGFSTSVPNGAAGAQRVFEIRDPGIANAPDATALPRRPACSTWTA